MNGCTTVHGNQTNISRDILLWTNLYYHPYSPTTSMTKNNVGLGLDTVQSQVSTCSHPLTFKTTTLLYINFFLQYGRNFLEDWLVTWLLAKYKSYKILSQLY